MSQMAMLFAMMFEKFFTKFTKPEPSRLARLLLDYAPYEPPFGGIPAQLTHEQASQNLVYLLAHRHERLTHLKTLLANWDIHPRDISSSGDYEPFVEELYKWAGEHWPDIHSEELADPKNWRVNRYLDESGVYAMLIDISLLFGEIIINRNPAFHWALDDNADNIEDEMGTVHRPVVQIAQDEIIPYPIIIDTEDIVFDRFQHLNKGLRAVSNDWLRLLGEAVEGAHEQFWRERPDLDRG